MRLGDVLHIKHGFAFKSEFFGTSGNYIVVTPGNFHDEGGFKPKSGEEKFFTTEPPPEFILREGDLIVAMTEQVQGLIGSSALVPEDQRYLHNQRIGLVEIVAPHLADRHFLYYLFNTARVRTQLQATATGAKVRHTAPGRIEAVRVSLPPLREQQRIASILSAYDDLIENNTRRIQILEEMAQAIYREWFVEFRFPSHEDVRMVDSELGPIPEGWMILPMQKVAGVVDCLHSKKPRRDESGTGILLQLDNIRPGGILDLSSAFTISDADYRLWTSRIEVREGDCVVTNVGRVGAVARVPQGVHAALGRNMTAIRPRRDIGPAYLIEYLLSPHMEREIQIKKDAGAIMDALNVKGIVRLSVPVPPHALADQFERAVLPIRRLIENLVVATRTLRSTRDLLLPRLISGEIDVSNLDIGNAEPAA